MAIMNRQIVGGQLKWCNKITGEITRSILLMGLVIHCQNGQELLELIRLLYGIELTNMVGALKEH